MIPKDPGFLVGDIRENDVEWIMKRGFQVYKDFTGGKLVEGSAQEELHHCRPQCSPLGSVCVRSHCPNDLAAVRTSIRCNLVAEEGVSRARLPSLES